MTYRRTLRELAFDTHGVITTRDAAEAGVPPVELRKLAARGALKQVGHGVYRMLEAPRSDLSEFAEAVALAGVGAVLADEAVLAALHLGQVNLRRIKVATDRRVRAKLPLTVELVHKRVPAEDRDYIDGVPAMSIPAAFRASKGRILPERLVDAVHEAARRQLISRKDERELVRELEQT